MMNPASRWCARPVIIRGPLTPAELERLAMHPGLVNFRSPPRQHEALKAIAALEGGRVIAACHNQTIVAYLTLHPPTPFQRWSRLEGALELGGIEVARPWRRRGVGAALMAATFEDPALEDCIVISSEYCWHWDLGGSGLDVWDYREMLGRFFARYGLQQYQTDEPNITGHPANMLMARIGSRVPPQRVAQFEGLLFLGEEEV